MLIALPDDAARLQLLESLTDNARITRLDPDGKDVDRIRELGPLDVAVLRAERLSGAYSPLLHDSKLGFPELVFVVDDTCSAQRFALNSRGFRYVVGQDDLAAWLPPVLKQLASLAQARRTAFGADAERPRAPELPSQNPKPRGMKLHAAETSFRDIFLRSLLAEHGSRRKAAEEAGVPYRSFCEMLRKLGI